MKSWFHESSSAEFWRLTERAYTAERIARELFYLRQILEKSAPGRRVVDVGCGLGYRAIGLAEVGFEVIGIEVSEWAIDEARRRGAQAGVDVRWEVVDLLAAGVWPLAVMDAAISRLPWLGWDSDAEQRRLLRRIRYHLAANGVLVIGCSPFRLTSAPSLSGEPERLLDHTACLSSPVALTSRVREAGFAVECLNVDFTPSLRVLSSSSTIQVIGRPLPVPPNSLAVTSWRNPAGVQLDLRYAPDEAELLDPSPSQIWEDLVLSVSRCGADIVASYPVDDPYGSERGAEVVSRYFGFPVAAHQLTFAAGVTSLLHHLCGLADGGLITAPELVHGDLEAWAVTRGVEFRLLPEPATPNQLVAELNAIRPALLHLDRPTFTGQLIALDELEAVVRVASRVGAVVLIDESPAPYLGPASSATQLVNQVDNLVVLRGFTKAYSWGGLRAGFALASDGVARHVRELVPPLQVAELALHAALKLLAAGDVFGRLRARIRIAKPAVIEQLEALGLEVIKGHEDLPWVAISDTANTASRLLNHCGICGLRPAIAPVFPAPSVEILRLTIPLSNARMTLFRRLLMESPGLHVYAETEGS